MLMTRTGYLPGCIGQIAALHARYYAAHAGFGVFFESKVAREFGLFCERHDPTRDGLWLIQQADSIAGSIVIDGSHAAQGAHLRWFIVSDALRGSGYGNQLMAHAVEFCRERGYERVYLWTFRGLDAARHLYLKFGFELVEEAPGQQWGQAVIEQRYELIITSQTHVHTCSP
jgi:GNAT superfamily N-acetyltransferase